MRGNMIEHSDLRETRAIPNRSGLSGRIVREAKVERVAAEALDLPRDQRGQPVCGTFDKLGAVERRAAALRVQFDEAGEQ